MHRGDRASCTSAWLASGPDTGSRGRLRVRTAASRHRVLASRRIVLVFNPASDDPGVLRTVVQLLRVSAIAACARQDLEEIETANERIREALEVITKIDDIRKAAGSIRVNANKIDDQGTAMQTTLSRLLTQALTALAGSTSTTSGDSSASDAA